MWNLLNGGLAGRGLELPDDQEEEDGGGGQAAEHDFGVLLDAVGLGQETEGLVDGHVANQREEEDAAEGSAGLGWAP